MNCTDILPLLSGHLDQANTAEEERLLQTHLARCADCRALLQQMEQNDALLAASLAEPPADLTLRIMSRIRGKKTSSRPGKRTLISWLATGAAAALLGFALVGEKPAMETAATGNEHVAISEGVEKYAADNANGQIIFDFEAIEETSACYIGNTDRLKTRHGVYRLLPEGTPPFLLVCNATPDAFPLLEGYTPDDDNGTVLLPKDASLYDDLLAALNGGLAKESISGKAVYRTFIVYTVPRDVMEEAYSLCDPSGAFLYDPASLYDAETCKIVFVQESDTLPTLPQSVG